MRQMRLGMRQVRLGIGQLKLGMRQMKLGMRLLRLATLHFMCLSSDHWLTVLQHSGHIAAGGAGRNLRGQHLPVHPSTG